MNEFEAKLKNFLKEHSIQGEHLSFEQSCHSVTDAARTASISREEIIKNICMVDSEDNIIVAIVRGKDRASTSRVGKALKIEKPRIASPEKILEKTGYPCGGVPSFGFEATFLIDPRVMEREIVYSSGGSENSLLKISPKEIQKANNGTIKRVRK